MSAETLKLSKLGLCALLVWVVCLLSSCAHKPARKAIEFTPINPDVPAVSAPVGKAKASTVKASDSAARAVVIVEKIVPSPGQEAMVATLKLELATTVEQLRLTSEQLDSALLQIPHLERQISDMKEWGLKQQMLKQEAYKKAEMEERRAEIQEKRAERNGKERDVFVNLFAVTLTIIALLAVRPLIAGIAASTGVYAPAVAIGLWIVSAFGAYLGAFWLIRGILRLLVVTL